MISAMRVSTPKGLLTVEETRVQYKRPLSRVPYWEAFCSVRFEGVPGWGAGNLSVFLQFHQIHPKFPGVWRLDDRACVLPFPRDAVETLCQGPASAALVKALRG